MTDHTPHQIAYLVVDARHDLLVTVNNLLSLRRLAAGSAGRKRDDEKMEERREWWKRREGQEEKLGKNQCNGASMENGKSGTRREKKGVSQTRLC